MRLPLEEWIAGTNLPDETQVAFAEAFRCFKAGAFRAALLFSYLGWGLALRNRILRAQCPAGFPESRWATIGEKLRNDDQWESQIFDCTQLTQPYPIFEVSESLRLQVRYWRDRRNDCAHSKANEIGSAYVESFWQFFRSNLPKFVPRGTMAAALEAVKNFFDPNRTPPGADIGPLVDLITESIEPAQAASFFQSVASEFQGAVLRRVDEPVTLFEGVLGSNAAGHIGVLRGYLASETSLLVPLLRRNPSRTLFWASDHELIRRLWRELLFDHGHQDLPVYAALLRNGLIPAAEIEEASAWVVGRLNGDVPGEQDLEALSQAGFAAQFACHAFEKRNLNKFAWGNPNATTIRWYLETFQITPEIASTICAVFSSPNFPYSVRDELGALFETNLDKRRELEAAAAQAEVAVPPSLLRSARVKE